MALGHAGRELLGADEAVFLQFLRGQGRGEQRVLKGAQEAVLTQEEIPVGIQGDGLSGPLPWGTVVDNAQPLQGHMGRVHPHRGGAEGATGLPVRQKLLRAVLPADHGFVRPRAPQHQMGAVQHQLFPVFAGGQFQAQGHAVTGRQGGQGAADGAGAGQHGIGQHGDSS